MTTTTMDCCSLDYTPPSKIAVMSGQRHGLSECSEECELDGSYTEFVETQWTKGSSRSSSELGKESPCHIQNVLDAGHEIGSDTESVVVNAPLHGPTNVRCVCVCKKRGCKFVDRPFDAQSMRESPIAKVSARYRLVTWLSSLRPHRGSDFPAADQIDVSSKVHPEKKSKIIQMFRSRRFRSCRTPGGDADTTSGPEEAAKKHYPGLSGGRRHVLPGRLKDCQLSVPRCFGVMVGMALVLLGMTYDHGVKHGVDNLLQDCWSWLRTSYMNFGDEFVSYNSLFFRMSNRDILYGEPYPRTNNNNKNTTTNATSFKDAINKVDPKFLFILEGLKLSVQVHFFSIDENSDALNPEVMVHDRGPLFFRISFRRTAGLHVEYVAERSNMTLLTPFHIYDLMKIITVSNGIPYFGMHMHDYLKTTPSALFNMIIDNLKLFNVDTTFLSSIQAQIQKKGRGFRRIRRRSEVEKGKERTRHYIPSASTTEQPRKATAGTVPGYTSAPVTTTKAAAGETTGRLWNTTSGLPFTTTTTLERTRRSTEEPNMKKIAWKALTEMSRKIFLPLPLDTKKTVLLPVPFIEKNLTLRYRHSVNVLGLPGYQFILGNDVPKNGNPWEYPPHDLYPSLSYSRVKEDPGDDDASNSHQQRHRYNDKKKHLHHRHSKHQNFLESDSYRKSFNDVLGVVDLEPLLVQSIGKLMLMGRHLENFPFWLSPPHFLSLADQIENDNKPKINIRESLNNSGTKTLGEQNSKDSLTKNNLVGVGGVSANEALHGSFIYYHPILGVPINASLAVQVGVRPPKDMLFSHKLVPIMWTRVQVEEVPRTLWYILWAACHLRETIMSTLICSGLLIITCSLTCRRKSRQERPGSA